MNVYLSFERFKNLNKCFVVLINFLRLFPIADVFLISYHYSAKFGLHDVLFIFNVSMHLYICANISYIS